MKRIVNKLAALTLCGLAAAFLAVPASQARARANISFSNFSCNPIAAPQGPSFTSVTCSFSTSAPAKVTVGAGADKKVLITVPATGNGKAHTVPLYGQPNTKYQVRLNAVGKNGLRGSTWQNFATLGPDATANGQTVPVRMSWQKSHWLLNGGRFVPLLDFVASEVCPNNQNIRTAQAIRVQVMLINACTSSPSQDIPIMHQLMVGQYWWNELDQISPDWSQPDQAELMSMPDVKNGVVAGQTDPIYNSTGGVCQAARGNMSRVVFPLDSSLSAGQMKSSFWLSVACGAELVFNDEGTTSAAMKEAGHLNAELATMSVVMTQGKPIRIKQNLRVPVYVDTGGNKWKVVWQAAKWPPIRLMGWRYGGKLYLLAVNGGKPANIPSNWNTHVHGVWHHYSWRASASLKLNGLASMKVAGLYGSKGLRVVGSTLSIHLPQYAAGWYVVSKK